MKRSQQHYTLASAIALSLTSFTTSQAANNPFEFTPVTNESKHMTVVAEKMYGSNMEGMCGGMGEGICGANMPQGISPDLLPEPKSKGAQLLIENCTQCHGLPGPGMHTSKEWPAVVDRMNMRMQMMDGMMGIHAPSQEEIGSIVNYLKKHAQVEINREAYFDLHSTQGQLFSHICSQCHVLPEPKQHTSEEWPAVIGRMLSHMSSQDKEIPESDQIQDLIQYLQRHSRNGRTEDTGN